MRKTKRRKAFSEKEISRLYLLLDKLQLDLYIQVAECVRLGKEFLANRSKKSKPPKCASKLSDHTPDVDEYYCTDGSLVALCKRHLPNCRSVVWDRDKPMTRKYYDEVYSK